MCEQQPSTPPAPDYAAAATAQGAANTSSAQASSALSNPNIYGPYGSQTVSYANTGPDGDAVPTINQSLTPEAQQTLDAQQQVQYGLANLGEQGVSTAQGIMGSPFQYTGPGIQTSLGNYGQVSAGPQANAGPSAQGSLNLSGVAAMPVNAGQTGYGAIMQELQPELQQQSQANTQQLANQGITPGSEAYNNAMRTQDNTQNSLLSQAAAQGINLDMSANQQGYNQALSSAGLYNSALGQNFSQNLSALNQNFNQGLSAEGQNYNQALQAGQFGNTAAQQAYQQQLSMYNQPLNEISALMSGSQIQNPTFQSYTGSNIAAAPVYQAAQNQDQYNQNLYGQQMASYNSGLGAIGGLLGSGLQSVGQAGGFAAMFGG